MCKVSIPCSLFIFLSHPIRLLHRYFETDPALTSHWRSKVHKRRCKQLKEPAYTIEEAERAGGLGREGKRTIRTVVGVGAIMDVVVDGGA